MNILTDDEKDLIRNPSFLNDIVSGEEKTYKYVVGFLFNTEFVFTVEYDNDVREYFGNVYSYPTGCYIGCKSFRNLANVDAMKETIIDIQRLGGRNRPCPDLEKFATDEVIGIIRRAIVADSLKRQL
jgi:hypothetical protein